jgi:hypothetical protein
MDIDLRPYAVKSFFLRKEKYLKYCFAFHFLQLGQIVNAPAYGPAETLQSIATLVSCPQVTTTYSVNKTGKMG